MLPHSDAKPVRLVVAGTHWPAVDEGDVVVAGGVVVDEPESQRLPPQDRVVGPTAGVRLAPDPSRPFCPQLMADMLNTRIAATKDREDRNRICITVYHT